MWIRRMGGKVDLTEGEKERSWIQHSRQAKTQKLEWATQEHIFRAGQRPKRPGGQWPGTNQYNAFFSPTGGNTIALKKI